MNCCKGHKNHGDNRGGQVGVVYTCPMHPEVRRESPGMCPECGMNLVPGEKSKEKNRINQVKKTIVKGKK